MSDTDSEARLPENNSLLTKLLATEGVANAMVLRGYVGPTTAEGNVTLYPRIDDVSECFEIAPDDILHSVVVPESVLPYGGTMIWVRKNANIVHRRVETSARLSDRIGNVNRPETEAGFAEVRKGRLRIQVRSRPAFQCTSCYNCRTCTSRCNTCHSSCVPIDV
jgi:hypothetical protein